MLGHSAVSHGFFFHGAMMLRSPNAELGLECVFEISDGDAGHRCGAYSTVTYVT